MTRESHEECSLRLWQQLDPIQDKEVMKSGFGDIDPEFLGFVQIYEHLSMIIPQHFTVVDLGCAYAPQSWYFRDHAAYIGVDFGPGARYSQSNTVHHNKTIANFLKEDTSDLDLSTTFAICSYVPPWHDNNRLLVRQHFENCFVFYPARPPGVKLFPKKE